MEMNIIHCYKKNGPEMTRSVFISLCVIIVTIHSTVQVCGPGEVEDSCPSNCSDACPTKEYQNVKCTTPSVCGTPQCKCRINTKRALNGTCIDTRQCPPFKCDRPNEVYVACPLYCPTDDCPQATPDGRCPLFGNILLTMECTPACRCIKRYWRKEGTCVPYEECPRHATPLPIFFWKK